MGCKQSVNVPSVVFSTQVCYSVEKDVICMDAKTFGAFLARVRREQGLTRVILELLLFFGFGFLVPCAEITIMLFN